MENQESAQTVAPSIEAPKQPELTVTDLTNIRSIVDVAVRRGTFVASEL